MELEVMLLLGIILVICTIIICATAIQITTMIIKNKDVDRLNEAEKEKNYYKEALKKYNNKKTVD